MRARFSYLLTEASARQRPLCCVASKPRLGSRKSAEGPLWRSTYSVGFRRASPAAFAAAVNRVAAAAWEKRKTF